MYTANNLLIRADSTRGCLPVTSGVPQGPMLFLLYINDLVHVVNPGIQIQLFTDYCILYKNPNSATDQDDLNNSLGSILKWCDEWGMILNANKCVNLPVTCKKAGLNMYKLGPLPLE